MQGYVYRGYIRKIVRVIINRHVPGLPPARKKAFIDEVAAMVHAKLYGAEVDGVISPIWRDTWSEAFQPKQTPDEILNEAGNDK